MSDWLKEMNPHLPLKSQSLKMRSQDTRSSNVDQVVDGKYLCNTYIIRTLEILKNLIEKFPAITKCTDSESKKISLIKYI